MNPSVYKRPAKPLTLTVRRRRDPKPFEAVATPEVVAVDRATECHVTPDDIAACMVEYLGPVGDYLTLEPSAGTGQLAKALLASGHSPCELTMVERHVKLASHLQSIGPTINECFLEYAERVRGAAVFPRIIMNPPFKAARKHIAAARSLLGKGGHDAATMVALVPSIFAHDGEELEQLPDTTFSTAKVRTKLIRFTA